MIPELLTLIIYKESICQERNLNQNANFYFTIKQTLNQLNFLFSYLFYTFKIHIRGMWMVLNYNY
jgi:hypothetical protein